MTHSNHSLTIFRRCPREYHYRYTLNRRPRFEESEATTIGGLVHKAIERYLMPSELSNPVLRGMSSFTGLVSLESLVASEMFLGWADKWGGFPGTVLVAEQDFAWKEFIGRFDAICEDELGTYVVEHKTVAKSVYGDEYQSKMRLDTQASLYLAVARELYDAPVSRIVYDVLIKPEIRPLKATPIESQKRTKDGRLYANQRAEDETLIEFRERLRGHLAYDRFEVSKTEAEVDRSIEELRETILAIEDGRTYRNPDACSRFGSLCSYFDVCTGCESIDSFRFVNGAKRS